jgi:uncharacterized protein YecT (DUF1311 family)
VRSVLLTLALGLAVTVSASGATAPSPPVIHEPFTPPLPCPAHPVSTVDLEGCGERALLRSDRAIDAEVDAVFRRLRPSARTSFVHGEQAWLRYRRASCSAEASKYAGGSAEPLLFLDCEARRNKTHLTDLNQTERVLRQH